MKALAIGWSNIRRMLRERSNVFFVFIFPIAIIFLVGAQFGGGVDPALGVIQGDDGQIAGNVVSALEASVGIEIRFFEDEGAMLDDIERGYIQAGVLLPAGLDETASRGENVEIGFVARPDGAGPQIQSVVGAAIADVMKPVGAGQFASAETGAPFEQTVEVATQAQDSAPSMTVDVSAVGESVFPESFGRFDLGAPQQLVLFVFLTALAGSAALILTRQLGISQRMLSTPTTLGSIVVGESIGRWGTAMVQGLYIIVLTWVIFRVNWGDPLGALLLLVVYSAVGAAAGILMGATFSNDQQAAGVGVILSIGLAALGGSMLPLEFFGETLQRVAHITPHAWAMDGYSELIRRGGNTGDILLELGVLALYAVVLFALAAWRLRVAITRP